MSVLSTITRYAADYRARRRRMRTYMHLTSLPLEIQKDIGWIDAFIDEDDERRRPRRKS